MKAALLRSRLQQLIAQRNGYLVLAAGLLLLSILLSLMVLRLIGHERVIITPPVVHRTFWVDHSEVSPEYLAEMTTFFAQLRLTVTPSSAPFQHETLLRYTDSAHYGELKNELVAETHHLLQSHISLAFYPTRVEADAKHLQARIEGDLYSSIGNAPAKPIRITYRVTYRYSEGRLLLQTFEEISSKTQE